MNRVVKFIFSLLLVSFFTGCGTGGNEGQNSVGEKLVVTQNTFTPVVDLPKENIQAIFNYLAQASGSEPLTANIAIKSYKINYITHDEHGNEVYASGLVTIPVLTPDFLAYIKQTTGRDFTLSIVSDQHGTIFNNSETPSAATTQNPNLLSLLFSSVGLFMTVQPDYIGFGDSNQTHPYIIEKSLANSTVDMIDAAIGFANQVGLPLNGQIFLSGYSEGGYATMAAAKEIQLNHPEMDLKAVAPMAGPYDVEAMGEATLSAPYMAFPPFLAYIAYAYSDIYGLDIKELVNEPYADNLSTIFDTNHTIGEIVYSLPLPGASPKDLFVPSFVDDYLVNKDNPLRVKFRENSLLDWTPQMPMKLVQCTNDEIIPYQITTQKAYDTFVQNGSTSVEIVPIDTITADYTKGEFVHGNCALAAYGVVLPWFNDVRGGKK